MKNADAPNFDSIELKIQDQLILPHAKYAEVAKQQRLQEYRAGIRLLRSDQVGWAQDAPAAKPSDSPTSQARSLAKQGRKRVRANCEAYPPTEGRCRTKAVARVVPQGRPVRGGEKGSYSVVYKRNPSQIPCITLFIYSWERGCVFSINVYRFVYIYLHCCKQFDIYDYASKYDNKNR